MRHFALAIALVAAPAIAQAPAPAKVDVKAGTYAVDPGHTQAIFTVNHFGVSEYSGQFTNPTGSLVLDPANHANDKVDITFPIDKVVTTVAGLNAHLQTPDFFDAAKFPTAQFVSTKVAVSGMNVTIDGTLTMHGVTKPVTLTGHYVGAAVMRGKTNIGFQATTVVKRSDWGMTFGMPGLSENVRLTINAAFAM